MSFPLEAVGEAAATELARETLLYTARPRGAAGAAGRRCKDLWEIEFKCLFVSWYNIKKRKYELL